MTQETQEPLRSKHWTPDHVRLAEAAETVRSRLRKLIEVAPLELRSELGCICNVLTWSLKARAIPRATGKPHPSNHSLKVRPARLIIGIVKPASDTKKWCERNAG